VIPVRFTQESLCAYPSPAERLILALTATKPKNPVELVRASRGRLSDGVYVQLERAVSKGLLMCKHGPPPPSGGHPRPYYRPSRLGRRVLRALARGVRRRTA
jgi:hypothetical protein